MKRFSLLLPLLFFVVLLHAETIEKTYYLQKPKITASGEYQLLEMPGLMITGKVGEPALPYQEVILLLPPGEKAISVEMEGLNRIVIPGEYQIYPQQPSRPLSQQGAGVFIKNESVYNTDQSYPYQPAGELTTAYLNGYAIALLAFTPLSFNPVNGEVAYFDQVKITVQTGPDEKSVAAMNNLSVVPLVQNRIAGYVHNPGGLKNYPAPAKSSDDYQILIITADQFENDFEEYIGIYTERGYKSALVTVETIDATGTGQDLPEKIRNYIIDEYQEYNIEFVLLGGDVEHVPYRGFYCYVESGSGYTDDNIPADLYYAALDGTWNDDNDNLWGEIGEDDLLPELAVARFSFSNLTELNNMINKTTSYQNSPVPGEFNDAVLAGEWLYSNPTTYGSDYLELLIGYQDENGYETWGIPEDYNFHKLYESVSSWSVNDLIDEINAGRQFIHHVGHANSTYVAYMSNSTITNSNFSGANGVDHNFTIFQSAGCICGAFDDSDCIMEKMVSIENFAVAVIGNSRYGWFNEGQTEGPSQHLHREMMDALYHEQMNHIGQAFMETKIQTAPWVTAPGQWEEGALRWNFYDINILGDPAMSIWTQEPIAIDVAHDGVYSMETGTYQATVTSDGEPMENFRCVLIYNDAIYGVGITDASGEASIAVDEITEPGDAQLIVSGNNCLPHAYDVTVIVAGLTYVHYTGHQLDDGLGNGNGQVDFGETFLLLDLTLENLGQEQANNIETQLASSSPYVTITDGTAQFGSIGSNSSSTVEDAFSFDVAEDIPDQTSIEFELTISWGDGEEEVINYFFETANAPDLVIGNYFLDDTQNGNGNGNMDPGETIELSIETSNQGHCPCASTLGSLLSASSYISIANANCDLGAMNTGETKLAVFTIEVDESTPVGTAVDLSYTASSGAYSVQQQLLIVAGLVIEDFESGDFNAFGWELSGDADWFVSGENPYEGSFSAKSGTIGDQQQTLLELSMEVLADSDLSFYRKVSSEENYDYLRFFIDGELMDEWSGEEDWALVEYPVTAGTHIFRWSYEKDYSVSNGSDCAWVDYIVFPVTSFVYTAQADLRDNQFRVYPNPSNGKFKLVSNINKPNAVIRVFDIMSQEVLSMQTQLRAGEPMMLDLSQLKPGVYVVSLSGEKLNSNSKVTVW